MRAYYNEFDPKAAAWLRELIRRGLIAAGDVDERSIADVRGDDLAGYTQCHFFAGIGGWSYALRLAGWPDDRPVWTGSCPCQPFSNAGQRKGIRDERHLWPEFRRLIAERQRIDDPPAVIFGEQVASKAGRVWLAGVRADLEELGYAVGSADLCAAGVGSPHIRQRLWWMADADNGAFAERTRGEGRTLGEWEAIRIQLGGDREGDAGGVSDANSPGRGELRRPVAIPAELGGTECSLHDAWSRFDIVACADGKARRIESGIAPLVDGIPARVVRLRGYGNAIVPEVAAEFIAACDEVRRELMR